MKRVIAAFLVAFLLIVSDLQQPPQQQWTTRVAVSGILLYQGTLSRWYARIGVRCRFTPTCSHYAEECLRRFGAVRGSWLGLKRVLRCGPWTPIGTIDLPPAA